MSDVQYTTTEAARAAGISRSMLLWLWHRGLAVPSIRNSRKAGSSSLWSDDDVAAIATTVRARHEIEQLARADHLPPIRVRQLSASRGTIAVGQRGVFEVTPKTTVAQLLRESGGGAVALVPHPARPRK